MYAAGIPCPQKEPCLRLIEKIESGEVDSAASAEVLQEILHRYRAIGRWAEGVEIYENFRELPIRWLDIIPHDVDVAKDLLTQFNRLSSRDALHVAVMKRNGIKEIVSYDQGFIGIPQLSLLLPDSI